VGPRITRELELDDLGRIAESQIDGMQFQPVPMEPGDVIIFDGLLPHKSNSNCSDSLRRALFLTFNRKKEGERRAEYFKKKCQLFPPEDQRVPGRDYRKIGQQFNLGNPFV
jgi:ectoine hydroxylase-related dioxygenase (phytanoyl-CoA dioxygenase family)